MRTVRFRAALSAALVFAVVVVALSLVLLGALRRALVAEVDRSNDARAADIVAQIDATETVTDLGVGLDGDTLAVVIVDAEVWGTSDFSATATPILDAVEFYNEPFALSLPDLAETEGADNLRGVGLELSGGSDELVLVASSLDSVDRTVAEIRNGTLLAVPLLVLVVGLLVWWLTGRALRPVEAIRAEAAAIGSKELDRRVPEPHSGDEISRLAVTMNQMLERLEQSQRRQKQFVSDASHELRSPLSSIAAQLDVDEAHPHAADRVATAHSVRDETLRMQSLIEDLLLLARSDAEAEPAHRRLVDLDDVIFSSLRSLIVPEGHAVDTSAVSAGVVYGDPEQLGRVVTNLLNNAVRHAKSMVAVSLVADGESAMLVVDDDGSGIRPEDRSRVFERFVRLDEARDRDRGGSGLGLAISSAIVIDHDGEIRASESPLGGARFEVILPSS